MLTLNYPNYCRVPPAVGRAHNGSARCSLETIVVRESRTRYLRRIRKTMSWLRARTGCASRCYLTSVQFPHKIDELLQVEPRCSR